MIGNNRAWPCTGLIVTSAATGVILLGQHRMLWRDEGSQTNHCIATICGPHWWLSYCAMSWMRQQRHWGNVFETDIDTRGIARVTLHQVTTPGAVGARTSGKVAVASLVGDAKSLMRAMSADGRSGFLLDRHTKFVLPSAYHPSRAAAEGWARPISDVHDALATATGRAADAWPEFIPYRVMKRSRAASNRSPHQFYC